MFRRDEMKTKLKYIFILLILVGGYVYTGKILDRLYLSKYDIVDYMGENRYSTVNSVLKSKYKKSDVCYFVNTDYLSQGISLTPYAYKENIPIFYIKKNEIPKEVYSQMVEMGIKKVIIVGGANYISNGVVRSLDRSNIESERIVASEGINFSLMMAEKMNKIKKINSFAVVTDDDLDVPNGITFLPYADRNNIPVFVIRNTDENIEKLERFSKKYEIKKTYLIGINNYYNTNLIKSLPNVVRISGKDRFEIDRKIMSMFYKKGETDKVFISKGGEVVHKRILAPGQLINALAITSLAADNNSPLMYIENNYFSTKDQELIKKYGFTQLNEVGFKIERRKFFNVERFKTSTTLVLIIISLVMLVRVWYCDKRPYEVVKVK